MKILVIGGTRFFGIHMVKELLAKGHEVTLATRGLALDDFGDSLETNQKVAVLVQTIEQLIKQK